MKNFIITFSFLFIFAACGQLTQTLNSNVEKVSAQTIKTLMTTDDCEIMKFRFLITQDYQAGSVIHHTEVFLDERAFSEENLKKLFSKISEKYSEATFLIVIVNTNWEQISMPIYPEDCPGIGISEQNGKPERYEYHTAKYYRRDANEFFTYNPALKTADFKDVILKGEKIYRNGAWQKP